MLEIRNITKYYRSKTGETVKALDDVSVSFPERGMVFILGKSGSGKSTLLNVIGGLDSIDGGEFIIKGKSSTEFVGSDFDAYRNTFIGFIFQEYNVLDDFSVGANIALALELQGRKAENAVVEKILSDVDLLGFAHRKPNELSGGQKQRVAIARALVKEPQIIMADEPTGALDSNTGKQIFDTLKKLSEQKLVLVVSHDRDFAERYADRIIELADGRIVSDVTKQELEGQDINAGIRQIGGNILQIKGGYRLTAEDLELINNYLATTSEGVLISGDARVNGELRTAAGITEDGGTTIFSDTAGVPQPEPKTYTKKDAKFIRSRLPMKNAVRMGASGLKHKKFRLVLTIFLSFIAFALFGLADTMAAYDKITAATASIMDANISQASISLGVRHDYYEGDDDEPYHTYYQNAGMNDDDIATLERETGLDFIPVFTGSTGNFGSSGFSVTPMMQSEDYRSTAYKGSIYGFVSMTEAEMRKTGYTLVGRMPTAPGELVISEFLYQQFKLAGFINANYKEQVAKGELTMEPEGEKSIIGKHLSCPSWFGDKFGTGMGPSEFLIVGVVDTGFDYARYDAFLPKDESDRPTGGEEMDIGTMLLEMELQDILQYGYHTLGFVCAEDMTTFSKFVQKNYVPLGSYTNFAQAGLFRDTVSEGSSLHYTGRAGGSELIPALNITWLDGTPRTTLAEKEFLIHAQALQSLMSSKGGSLTTLETLATERYGENWYGANKENSYWELLRMAEEKKQDPSLSTDDAYATVEAVFLPVVAEAFGVTVDGEGWDNVKEPLRMFLMNVAPGKVERYNVENTYIEIYCRVAVYQDGLMENPAFMQVVREYYSSMFGDGAPSYDELLEADKHDRAYNVYIEYIRRNNVPNAFGKSYQTLANEATGVYLTLTGQSMDSLLDGIVVGALGWDYSNNGSSSGMIKIFEERDWKVVGTFDNENEYDLMVSDSFLAEAERYQKEQGMSSYREVAAPHNDGIWAYAITAMPHDRSMVEKLVQLSYSDKNGLQFSLQNEVMHTLGNFNEIIETCALVFLFVGIGFAVFSGLLLMNFISISISYKKRDIGILRAVGARSSDVFKIFFSESLIIALINFLLAVAAVVGAIFVLNSWMYREGIRITLLSFGVRQTALMLLISVSVALLSSFLPVWRIARKKPVDAIKDR